MSIRTLKRSQVTFLFLVAMVVASHVHAAVVKWDGGGGDDDWGTAANWSPNGVPGNNDDVVLDATSSKNCILRASDTVKSLSIRDGYAGKFAMSKAELSLMGSAFLGGRDYEWAYRNGVLRFLGESGHDTIVPPPPDNDGKQSELKRLYKLGNSTTHVANHRLLVGDRFTVLGGTWDFGGEGRHHVLSDVRTENSPFINFDACTVTVDGNFFDCKRAKPVSGGGVLIFRSRIWVEWGYEGHELPHTIIDGFVQVKSHSVYGLQVKALDLINGSLDLRGADLSVTEGDLLIRPGQIDSTGLFNLDSISVEVAGNAYFAACFEDTLNMAAPNLWTLDVAGSIMARGARIGNCKVIGGQATADFTCIDAEGNEGWNFLQAPPHNPPYRFLKYVDRTDESIGVRVWDLVFLSQGNLVPSTPLIHPTEPRPYIASPTPPYGEKQGTRGYTLIDAPLDGGSRMLGAAGDDTLILDLGPGNAVFPDSIAFNVFYSEGPQSFIVTGSANGRDWDTLLDTSNISQQEVYDKGGGFAIPVPKASIITVSRDPASGGTVSRNQVYAAVTIPEPVVAYPADGYRFGGWRSVTGDISIDQPNSEATSITLNTISDPLEIQAVFECMPTTITQEPTAPSGPIGVGSGFSLEFDLDVCPGRQNDLSLQWEQKGASGLWNPVVGADSKTYSVASAAKADSGSYRAVIYDGAEYDTTSEVLISVLAPPAIPENQPTDISSVPGVTVVFRVDASGDGVLSYQWFEDGFPIGGNADTLKVGPVDEGYDGNQYYVVVTNEVGSATSGDAMLEIGQFVNPFDVTVENVNPHDTTHVKLTVGAANLEQYPTTGSLTNPTYIDSVVILYSAAGQPTSLTSPGVHTVRYSAGEVLAAGNVLVVDNLEVVPKPPDAGDNYYFGVAARWCLNENCTEDTLTSVKAATPVVMRDTITPVNVVSITGEYGERDTNATLTLSNLNAVDEYTDSVVVTAGYNSDFTNPFYSSALDAAALRTGPSSSELVIHHRDFPGELDTVHLKWRLKGRNGLYSPVKDTIFTVGVLRPVYGGVFSVQPGSLSDRIIADWDMTQPTVDSIRLWWIADQDGTVPLGAVTVPGAAWKVLTPASVSDTITGLTGKILYHVGFQIKQDGLWSAIAENTRDTATTSGFDETSTINNVTRIQSAVFDSDLNKIKVTFSLDYAALEVETDVRWGFTHDRDSTGLFGRYPSGWNPARISGDTTVYLDLGEAIPFNSTYYVGLWLQGKGPVDWGKPSEPTDSSFAAVEIGAPTWEVVSYLFDKDTVRALGGKLLLVKAGEDVFETDTIRVVEGDAPEGLVPVSDRIRFVDHRPTARFKIGLRIDAPGDAGKIRLYRETGTQVLVEHGSFAQGGYTWLKTNDLAHPFRAYIDTMVPEITLNETVVDTSEVLSANTPSKTSFKIKDNIDNAIWRVTYSTGKADHAEIKTGTLSGRSDSVTLDIDRTYASQSYGLRVIIEGADGGQTARVNASRDIQVDVVETYPVSARAWTPVRTPFRLNEPSVSAILGEDGTLTYNNEEMRLFRWMPKDGNGVTSFDNWAEYSSETSGDFSFVPGKLMWLKLAESRTLELTGGVTTSLRSPYEITLAPKGWTDFSTPYKFDIFMGDVLDSSEGVVADTIQIVKWEGQDGKYTSIDIYYPNMPGEPRKEQFIKYNPKRDGYSVYNPFENEVKLRIPPEPTSQSIYGTVNKKLAKTTRPEGSWSLSCVSQSDEGILLNPVSLGYVPGAGNEPTRLVQRPTMLPYGVCVRDEEGKRWAHEFAHSMRQGGVLYTVEYYNTSSEERSFQTTIQKYEQLGGNGVRVFEEVDGRVVEVSSTYEVTVQANSEEQRWIAVGDQSYLNSAMNRIPVFKLAFAGAYPNPFRSQVNLEFTLPVTGVKDLSFKIYSASGREVWRYEIGRRATAGRKRVTWNGRDLSGKPVAAGVYFVRMKAIPEGSNKPRVFTTRLTYMP